MCTRRILECSIDDKRSDDVMIPLAFRPLRCLAALRVHIHQRPKERSPDARSVLVGHVSQKVMSASARTHYCKRASPPSREKEYKNRHDPGEEAAARCP